MSKPGPENPFAGAFARHSRHSSKDTETTRNDSMFDNASAHQSSTASPSTPGTDSHLKPLPQNASTTSSSQPSRSGSCEPFPEFTNPFEEEEATHINHALEHPNTSQPEQIQNLGQQLVSKLRSALTFIRNVDQTFETWTREREEKRAVNKHRSEVVAHAKEIDNIIRGQIKTHREKEKARNKRAKQQLKSQKKELKRQERKIDQIARGQRQSRWKMSVYNRLRYVRSQRREGSFMIELEPSEVRTETMSYGPPALSIARSVQTDPYTGTIETQREIDSSGED